MNFIQKKEIFYKISNIFYIFAPVLFIIIYKKTISLTHY